MTNDQAQTAAQAWHGQAGGRLCPQLTENELSGLVNEAIQAAVAADNPQHRHEWIRTGAMPPGVIRCITCGHWGKEAQAKTTP